MTSPSDSEDDEPMPSLAAGALIGGKYRIEGLIGRGGMGSVWSAVHASLGQRVAVKLIAKRYAASREARHRFDLEAKAAAQLRSRYVVQVYDHGETPDGTPYIVMEYLEGETLDARVSRGPLPVQVAGVVLEQIGRALGRAHQLGMVHRDLKPENVFLTTSQDGDGEVAKVLDFGIVKMKGNEGIGSSTRTGAVLGTPLYMSPEQARGLKSVDHRTDLYSLGMVAYTMLTGQPAFTGESLGDLLVAICTEPLPNVRALAAWLPPALDGWFQRACAREPADRFATAEELTVAFAVAAGLRAAAPSPGEPVPAPQVAPTSPAALLGATTNPTREPVPAITAPTDHTAAPFSVTEHGIPKRSLVVPVAVAAAVVALVGGFIATRFARAPAAESASASSPSAVMTRSSDSAAPSALTAVPAVSAAPEAPPSARARERARPARVDVAASGSALAAPVKPAGPSGPTVHAARPGRPGPNASVAHAAAESPAVPPSGARPPTAPKPSHVDLGF